MGAALEKAMKISPNIQIAIGVIVAVLTAAAQGAIKLPMGVPPEWGAYFVSWDNFLLTIYSYAAPAMLAFSSSAPGPLAPPDPKVVVAAQKVADLPADASPATITQAKAAATAAIDKHDP
jgi:hypothetical protein